MYSSLHPAKELSILNTVMITGTIRISRPAIFRTTWPMAA